MPRPSKRNWAAREEQDEPKSVRKRTKQRRQKTTSNLDASKDLEKQSNLMAPSGHAANSDGQNVPSGKNKDNTASTSKGLDSTKKPRGRYSRRYKNTPQDSVDKNVPPMLSFDLTKDSPPSTGFQQQAYAPSAYPPRSNSKTNDVSRNINEKRDRSTSKKETTESNFNKSDMNKVIPKEEKESEGSEKKGTHQPNLTIKFDPKKETMEKSRKTQGNVHNERPNYGQSDENLPPAVAQGAVVDTANDTATGFQQKKVAPSAYPPQLNSKTKFSQKIFIKGDTKFPNQSNKKNATTESKASKKDDPIKEIEKQAQHPEPPIQRGSQSSKKVTPQENSSNKLDPIKGMEKQVEQPKPIQHDSKSSKKTTQSNLIIKLNPIKKTTEKSRTTQGDLQNERPNAIQSDENVVRQEPVVATANEPGTDSQQPVFTPSPQSNSRTKCDQKIVIEEKSQNTESPVQKASRSSKQNATTESNSPNNPDPVKEMRKLVEHPIPPIQRGSEGFKGSKNASQTNPSKKVDPKKEMKNNVEPSKPTIQRESESSKKKVPFQPNLIIKFDPKKDTIEKSRNTQGALQPNHDQSSAQVPLVVDQEVVVATSKVINDALNCCPPSDPGTGIPQQVFASPQSTSRTAFDPRNVIEEKRHGSELPIQKGPQSRKKNAATNANLTIKFDPKTKNMKRSSKAPGDFQNVRPSNVQSSEDMPLIVDETVVVASAAYPLQTRIKVERQDSDLCAQSTSQSARNMATLQSNWNAQLLQRRPIKQEVQDNECDSESSSQTAIPDFDSNRAIKQEVQDYECDLQSSWQTAIPESNSCTDFKPNKTIKREVKVKQEVQCGSQTAWKAAIPESNSWTYFDPKKPIKREVKVKQEVQSGSQSAWKTAIPVSSSWTDFDPKKAIKKEVNVYNCIAESNSWTDFDPKKAIKQEVEDQSSLNMPCTPKETSTIGLEAASACAINDLLSESNFYFEFDANNTISKEVIDCALPSQGGSQGSRMLTLPESYSSSIFDPEPLEKQGSELPTPRGFESSGVMETPESNQWADFDPNMFIEEQLMDLGLPQEWFDFTTENNVVESGTSCNMLSLELGQQSSNDVKDAEPSSENNDLGFKEVNNLNLDDLLQSMQHNEGLDFDAVCEDYASLEPKEDDQKNSKGDGMDARLGAQLCSGTEPMPKSDSPEEGKSAVVMEREAEIDARLQAELDSLPLVEVTEEADKTPDHILGKSAGNQRVLPMIKLPTASTSTAPNKPIDVIHPGSAQMPRPVAGNLQRPLTQVPMVAQLTGLQGQVVSLTYTTAPDGLVTSVSATSADMPQATPLKKAGELESLTASQLHEILQSGKPYFTLPMIAPGGSGAGEYGPRDAAGGALPNGQTVEDEEVDYEEIGVADTFAEYWPSKLKLGMAHPDPVVETATLSSVELPDITYKLSLPEETTSCLSALQLEAVIYACQAHAQILPSGERAGFLLGDGAGVGKGRTIAGIIYDNYLKGRERALWISVSNDLKFDAERDLYDIGAQVMVKLVVINKFKYSRIDSEENENFKKGVIFCTYTALIGESLTAKAKYNTRLRQLVHWLGKNFDGVIVFDECHKAKNLSLMNVGKSTKTGTTVLELQKLLPHARVVYASATGASEPRNMAYMVRLGLWGPGTAYPEFFEFVNAVEKRGIGAMEIVAMDMKLRGTYIARQLSFKDVSFRIEEVIMPREFRKTYNLAAELWAEINKKFVKACRLMCIESRVQKIISCQFWCAHQRFFKNLCIASKVHHVVKMTRQAMRMGKAVVIGLQSTGESRTLEHLERHNGRLSSFVSTSKMIIQSFVEKHFPAPKRDSFHRLLNTGEFEPEPRYRPPRPKKAKMCSEWVDDDMDAEAGESDIEMYENSLTVEEDRAKTGRKRRGRPPKVEKVEKITMQERILQHLCNNMRAQDNGGDATFSFDNTKLQKANITEHDVERCIRAREMLLDKIEILGRRMPSNTLDKLISELGGTNLVAEMTGRRGRVVRTEYDGYKYEPRCESDTSMDLVNYREKQRFMVGDKHVAIISEAASSGISLQSDKRVSNQRRRLHITLELPWSADRAIQQFGRTHRSNQVNSPEYVFVITDLAGERRFASTVAKRLESLGALTQGDRRATDARDLSQFNIDNSIGRTTLENVMQQLTGEKPLDHSNVPASYRGDFLYDCSVAMAGVGMLNVREENKVKLFSVEKDSNNMSKFLNRILGCRVEVQNALFKFFLDKMYSLIKQMKRSGHFDLGIVDLDAHGACVKSVKLMRFMRKHATGTAATELHTVTVERGMSYETALAKFRKEGRHDHEGFYVLQQLRHNKNAAILCLQAQSSACSTAPGKVSLQLYRPNTGPQVRLETLSSISSRYVKVEPEAAREFWQHQFDVCLDKCSHVFWNRACSFPAGCEMGLRVRTYHVLSGLMLPIWDRIELILEKSGHKIQIIRVKTDVKKKIVGTVVPHGVYNALVADLSSDSIVENH